jgi:hypothetical protein
MDKYIYKKQALNKTNREKQHFTIVSKSYIGWYGRKVLLSTWLTGPQHLLALERVRIITGEVQRANFQLLTLKMGSREGELRVYP